MIASPFRSNFLILLGFCLLFLCGGSILWFAQQQRAADGWVQHTFAVERQLDQMQILAMTAEIGRRGYVASGDQDSLRRFTEASAQLGPAFRSLSAMTSDNSRQQQPVANLKSALESWQRSRTLSVALRRAGKAVAAAQVVTSNETRVQTTRLLAAAERLYEEEARLLKDRQSYAAKLATIARGLLLASVSLALLLAILVFRDRRLQIRSLRQANDELAYDIRQREIFEAELTRLANDASNSEIELRETGRKFADSNRLLTMAQAAAKLGHWRIDYATKDMFWSDEVFEIYGLPRGSIPGAEAALSLYHPGDVDRVRQNLATSLAANDRYTSESRVIRPDGVTIHVSTHGEVDYDAGGKPIGLFGIVQDVSDRVQAEVLLREREAQLRLLTDHASDMITLHDRTGKCLFASPASRAILGCDPAEMFGTTGADFVAAEDRHLLNRHHAELAASPPGTVSIMRFRMNKRDGTLVWVEVAASRAEVDNEARTVAVSRDVTEQVAAEKELQVARLQAEEAVVAKASFLANMSHEIRTPMNGVLGFTELLLADELTEPQRQRAEIIADSGRAMMRLLNDILDVSKVEAGQMVISKEPFDLRHALAACIKLVTPALEKKGLVANCEIAADTPTMVHGDGLRLRQIILNLMGNAAKFTIEGSVTLRARPLGDGIGVLIEVVDTGIGISADRQAAVFQQFVQADAGILARFGGSGLGLTISRQLAELMGGHIRLQSEEGKGSTFSLTLPLPPFASAEPVLADAGHSQSQIDKAALRSCRVLVAEDHDINQMLMKSMLEKLGFRMDLAVNGVEAVSQALAAHASDDPFSIILMDMQMPKLGGLEAARQIRAAGIDAATLPIVALTANAFVDDVTACFDAGMQAHLGRPVALADLDTAIRRWAFAPAAKAPAASKAAAATGPSVQDRYRARREEALAALDGMIREGRFESAELAGIADLMHKLAGTAGMFGEAALGDAARLLEEGLEVWPESERPSRIRSAVEDIKRAA